jgi:Fur family ferric uptake transcriptional regulator
MPQRSHAEELICQTRSRVTMTRVSVLSFLLQQSRPFTHSEIESQMGTIDSVTLYRVLDWLVERELVHRVGGDDQTWRFRAGSGHASHEHAHFQCLQCSEITCFDDIKLPRNISIPAGFSKQQADFFIKGICPQCS